MVKRFDVYLLSLDEPLTKNARNTRPCVVVSPDEMNDHLPHVLIAPISTSVRKFPTRIGFEFLNRDARSSSTRCVRWRLRDSSKR